MILTHSKIFIVLFSLVFIQCSQDKTIDKITSSEQKVLEQYQQLDTKNKTSIPDAPQNGEKLLLCLNLVDKKTNKAISNKVVKFYYTSEGFINLEHQNYNPNKIIDGLAITDSEGRICVQTFLHEKNSSIGLTVLNKTPNEFNINFKQYLTNRSEKWVKESNEHFLANLKRLKDGALVSFLTIEINR